MCLLTWSHSGQRRHCLVSVCKQHCTQNSLTLYTLIRHYILNVYGRLVHTVQTHAHLSQTHMHTPFSLITRALTVSVTFPPPTLLTICEREKLFLGVISPQSPTRTLTNSLLLRSKSATSTSSLNPSCGRGDIPIVCGVHTHPPTHPHTHTPPSHLQ